MLIKGQPIAVLLVDDHAVVREGYRRLLERAEDIRVVGEAASAAQAYLAFCQVMPDVVVMDISLPDSSGVEALRRLLVREPGAKVLMFSMHDEPIFPTRCLAAGACGYVSKASAPEVLVAAVRAIARGEYFLSPDIAHGLALQRALGNDGGLACLSTREFEIARLLALGHPVQDIARRLNLSPKTIANHQSCIRQKLGAINAVQLVRMVTQSGALTANGL